jgi:hypothetical protein
MLRLNINQHKPDKTCVAEGKDLHAPAIKKENNEIFHFIKHRECRFAALSGKQKSVATPTERSNLHAPAPNITRIKPVWRKEEIYLVPA